MSQVFKDCIQHFNLILHFCIQVKTWVWIEIPPFLLFLCEMGYFGLVKSELHQWMLIHVRVSSTFYLIKMGKSYFSLNGRVPFCWVGGGGISVDYRHTILETKNDTRSGGEGDFCMQGSKIGRECALCCSI